MKHISRPLATGLAMLALTGALVAGGASAAQAYPATIADVDIVVFSNTSVNDTSGGGEVENETAVLQSFGPASLTTFDGGDGSATAWTAALAGAELLVIPDPENGDFYLAGGLPWVSDAAFQVIKAWVEAGGYIIANGNYYSPPDYEATYGDLLTGLTGGAFGLTETATSEPSGPYDLAVAVVGAPDPLPYQNGTYSLPYGSWSAELQALALPVYLTADLTYSPVVTFAVGSGAVLYLGYDWYESASTENEWAAVLGLAASGGLPLPTLAVDPEPAGPALAATGDELPLGLGAGAAVLLIAGIGLVVWRRRATS